MVTSQCFVAVQGAKFNSNRRKEYGNVFKTNVLLMPMIKVTGHEFVSEVSRTL